MKAFKILLLLNKVKTLFFTLNANISLNSTMVPIHVEHGERDDLQFFQFDILSFEEIEQNRIYHEKLFVETHFFAQK